MAIYGPTPADWAAQQEGRRDDQIRQMMQMVMASKQWQEEQRRYKDTLQQRDYQNTLDLARTQAYVQNVTEPNQPQPTEMMRNWQFLEGQYPGQDIGPMVVPGLREQRQPNEYQYDLDPTSAAEIEKAFGLPTGATAQMGPRQREDAFNQYQARRFPKPDTNVPLGATLVGRQKETLNMLLQDVEQRRSSMITRHDSDRPEDEVGFRRGLSDLDGQIQTIRGGLMQIAATNRELGRDEWEALTKKLSTAGGGVSPKARELAEKYGVSPEEVQELFNGVASGKIK